MVMTNNFRRFKFLQLIVLALAGLVNAAEITYYVTGDSDYGGADDGSFDDPFTDLINALNQIQEYPPDEATSYTYLLVPSNETTFELTAFENDYQNTPFLNLTEQVESITISSLYWEDYEDDYSPLCSDDIYTRAILDYKSPSISFTIEGPTTIIFENIVFTSQNLVIADCDDHWCSHCHFTAGLELWYNDDETEITNYVTAMGHDFGLIEENDQYTYYLESTYCGWGDDGIAEFDPSSDTRTQWWLFSVKNDAASLQINNSKFQYWRFFQLSVIHIYYGEVVLTNVDFENTEATQHSMSLGDMSEWTVDGHFFDGDRVLAVPGIITATSESWWGCANGFGDRPAPCGRFEWRGGSVTGHNIDMNPYTPSEKDSDGNWIYDYSFQPFLNLIHLDEVIISEVTAKHNFMMTSESSPSLFTVRFCSSVLFEDMRFEQNWLESGAIAFMSSKEYLPIWEDETIFDGVSYVFQRISFMENKFGMGSTISSLMNIGMISWVNIDLIDLTFEYGEALESKYCLGIQMWGDNSKLEAEEFLYDVNGHYCWEHAYLRDQGDVENYCYNITDPITINVIGLKMENNFGGDLVYLYDVPKIYIQDSEFKSNTDEWWDRFDLANYFIETVGWIRDSFFWYYPEDSYYCYSPQFNSDSAMEIYFQNVTFEGNNCGGNCIVALLVVYKFVEIDNLKFQQNVGWCFDQGMFDIQPWMDDPDSMPVVKNSQFLNNENGYDPVGFGGLSLFKATYSSMEQPRLTVENCLFESNESSSAAAINWQGAGLTIIDTIFRTNTIRQSEAAVWFRHTRENDGTDQSVLTMRRVTFDGNTSAQTAADIHVSEMINIKTITVTIEEWTFTSAKWEKCPGILFSDIILTEAHIENSTFRDSELSGYSYISFEFKSGDIDIENCTFTNLTSDESLFIVFGVSLPEATVSIKNTKFTNSIGKYGISFSNSARIKMITENITVTGNDLQFLNINNIEYEDRDSTIQNNKAVTHIQWAPYFQLNNGASALITNTTVTDNTAESYAGAIHVLNTNSYLRVDHSRFERNKAVSTTNPQTRGGVILVENVGQINITDTLFQGNSAYFASAIMINSRLSIENHVKNCQFIQNEGNTIIALIDSWLVLEDSTIDRNFIGTGTEGAAPGITSLISKLDMKDNTFSNHECRKGCFLTIQTASTLTDKGSTFTNAKAKEAGVMYIIESTATFEGTRFVGNTANEFADIYAQGNSYVNLQYAHFENSKSIGAGPACISMRQSRIDVNQSTFQGFNTTAIEIQGVEEGTNSVRNSIFKNGGSRLEGQGGALSIQQAFEVKLDNVTFQDLSGFLGGAVFMIGFNKKEHTEITNSKFERWKSEMGGAIYSQEVQIKADGNTFSHNVAGAYSDTVSRRRLSTKNDLDIAFSNVQTGLGTGGAMWLQQSLAGSYVKNTQFTSNEASIGGGIFLDGLLNEVENSNFEQNVATHFGGGIYYRCELDACPFQIKNTEFKNNVVQKFSGGGTYYEDVDPVETNVTFKENAAPQGADHSGKAAKVSSNMNRRLSNSLIELKSGQGHNIEFKFEILDSNNQRIVHDNSTYGGLSSDAIIKGEGLAFAVNGVLTFTNFTVTAQPETNVTIKVQSYTPSLEENGAEIRLTTSIDVYMLPCDLGEQLTLEGACVLCDANGNEYTFEAGSNGCTECPQEAVCYGGIEVYPKKDYWRETWDSETFYEWYVQGACLGGEANKSYSGDCEKGFEGPLCTVCSDSYTRQMKHGCRPCIEEDYINFTVLALFFVLMGAFALFLLNSAIKLADTLGKKSNTTVLLRIMTNYVQLIALVQSLSLEWPDFVKQYHNNQERVTSSAEQIFSIDCIHDFGIPAIYTRLILISLLPLVMIVYSILLWITIKIFSRIPWTMFLRRTKGTIINLLFLVHPVVIKICLLTYSCIEIEKKQLLDQYMDDECWVGQHAFYAITVALPATVIWGFGLPITAYYILKRRYNMFSKDDPIINDDSLDDRDVKVSYGFLYLGYRKDKYWWELVILGRKVAILFNIVWLNNISPSIQALVGLLILYICLQLQTHNMPYMEYKINRVEILSLTAGITTIYLGQYYMSGELGQVMQIVIFFLIWFVTLYFLFNWVKAYTSSAVKQSPFLRAMRLEKYYIDKDDTDKTPWTVEAEADRVVVDRTRFVKRLLNGKLMYTEIQSDQSVAQMMRVKDQMLYNLMHDLVDEAVAPVQNTSINEEVEANITNLNSPRSEDDLVQQVPVMETKRKLK